MDEVGGLEVGLQGRLDVRGARQRQIIATVRTMIARAGIKSVTIANIASEMGVSRGVIDYHFVNKEAILHEALQSAIRDGVVVSTSTSESDDLTGLVLRVAELASSQSDWWPIYVAYLAESHGNQFYRKEILSADRLFRKGLEEVTGSSRKAVAVLAVMKGLALQRLVDDSVDVSDVLKEFEPLLAAPTTRPSGAGQ